MWQSFTKVVQKLNAPSGEAFVIDSLVIAMSKSGVSISVKCNSPDEAKKKAESILKSWAGK